MQARFLRLRSGQAYDPLEKWQAIFAIAALTLGPEGLEVEGTMGQGAEGIGGLFGRLLFEEKGALRFGGMPRLAAFTATL